MYRSVCGCVLSFLLGSKMAGSYERYMFKLYKKLSNCFQKMSIAPAVYEHFTSSPTLETVSSFIFSHSNRWVVVSHYGFKFPYD